LHKKKDSDRYISTYVAGYLSQADYKKTERNHEEIQRILNSVDKKTHTYLKNIIENLDKQNKYGFNALDVYEKDDHLTFRAKYDMPSLEVWDRLKQASAEGRIAETVLLSIFILRNTELKELYPGLFRDVLSSLDAVGFKSVSRDLAIEALLGDI